MFSPSVAFPADALLGLCHHDVLLKRTLYCMLVYAAATQQIIQKLLITTFQTQWRSQARDWQGPGPWLCPASEIERYSNRAVEYSIKAVRLCPANLLSLATPLFKHHSYMYACMHVHTSMYVCIHACIYICMYVYGSMELNIIL